MKALEHLGGCTGVALVEAGKYTASLRAIEPVGIGKQIRFAVCRAVSFWLLLQPKWEGFGPGLEGGRPLELWAEKELWVAFLGGRRPLAVAE